MGISAGDILLVTPMIVLFLFSLIPITVKVLKGNQEQPPLATLMQALVGIFLAAGLQVVFNSGGSSQAFSRMLIFDGIGLWTGVIALLATGGALILMYENPATKGRQFSEVVFLTLSSATGMLILVGAVDLLMVFIGLEMMSLPLYLIIAMSHEEKLSKEAAFKYFILGSFASAIMLFGISFIFGSSGTTNILDLLDRSISLIQTSRVFLFGMVLLFVGFCFKVSIVPFQAWTPDVYQGAPTPMSSFMATAIKTVSFAAFLRVIATKSLLGSQNLLDFFQWAAVITMLVGNVGAILQSSLKRMLAYSSISHSGYMLVALIAAGVSSDQSGATASAAALIFYLFGYSVMTLGAFAISSILERSDSHIVNVEELAGFAKSRPILAMCFSIFLLSLAGIPPLLGFFGKLYLFNAAIGQGLLWLAVWGMLNSVISVYYYLRPIVVMYMKEGTANVGPFSVVASMVTIIVSAIIITCMGVFSGPIFSAIEMSL